MLPGRQQHGPAADHERSEMKGQGAKLFMESRADTEPHGSAQGQRSVEQAEVPRAFPLGGPSD